MKKILICLTVISVVIAACSKTNEEAENANNTQGPAACDTINMKYTANVKPILEANCYGCHGSGQSTGGVNIETYNRVKQLVDNGLLIGVITHATGYSAMPKGKPKLSDCDINKIRGWIARGTLND